MLEVPWGKETFPRARIGSTLPVVLSPEEVSQFFAHVPSIKYRAVLMLCYGAGLRIGEAIAVKVSDIDSKRMVIRIADGKGEKIAMSCCHPACAKYSVLTIELPDPPTPQRECPE
jgi:integrase